MTTFPHISGKSYKSLSKAIRAGLPIKRLDEFQRRSGLPWGSLSRVLRLPPRTLARRRKAGRLSTVESDRLVRIVQIFEQATGLLQGDAASASAWFQGPCRGLGGQSPLSAAETELGAAEVEQLLGRLEYGVFS
jgi:putative toxin-antitoxin system antitoxin component (TIGR02293 family)